MWRDLLTFVGEHGNVSLGCRETSGVVVVEVLLELELEMGFDHLLGVLLHHHSGENLVKPLLTIGIVDVEGSAKVLVHVIVEL